MPPVLPPHEEGFIIWMGPVIPESVWQHQEVLLKFTSSGSTNSRESSYTMHCSSRDVFRGIMHPGKWGRQRKSFVFVIHTLVGAELNYCQNEKMYLTLMFAIQKLRHYMQGHTVQVISKADPIKYILSRPILSGRLAKWAVIFKQCDLVYVP